MFIFKKILYILLLVFITSKFTLANSEHGKNINTIPLDEIRTFTEIFSKIKSDYVEDLDDKVGTLKKKLENESFLKNAPKQIVEKEKKVLIEYEIELKKLNSILNSIKN